MNLPQAAERTLIVSQASDLHMKAQRAGDKGSHTELYHITWMLEGIIAGYIQHEKAYRWLGWAQAILVSRGITNVHTMKRINKGEKV